jgi:anti-sigma regulatory factor (Ser/Thr protein kinase)
VSTPKTPNKTGAESSSPQSETLLRLHLESNPESLCLVRATLQRAAEILEFRDEETRAIVRSVDEALANVIRHAYKGQKGKPIVVSCSRVRKSEQPGEPVGLEIVLEDSGEAPDPGKLKSRSLQEIRPGGLGLHFINQSMDVVEFSRKEGQNVLRLVKYPSSSKLDKKGKGE